MRFSLSGADASGLSQIRTAFSPFFNFLMKTGRGWQKSIAFTNSAGFLTHSHFHHHRIQNNVQDIQSYTKVQKPHKQCLRRKKLETFFKEGTTQTFREKKRTQTDNRAFRWSNLKKFQKSRNVSNRTSLKERRGREQTAAAAETSEAVICEIPPRLRLSFHSTLESYIHIANCVFILYLAYHFIDPPEQNGFEKFLKGLIDGLQKSVFSGCSVSCTHPRK